MLASCGRCGLLHPESSPCFSIQLFAPVASGVLSPGSLLADRYHVVRALHQGGMSVVYLAEDRVRQSRVALKELHLPEDAGADGAREAEAWFARESYLLSSLCHPLIPAFYSVFRETSRSYLVQEYVEGENLEELVSRQGPPDPRTVAGWGQALCDLLTYLHQQQDPVIFRDLKPSNILLRRDGRLAVVDFGIARRYQPGQIGTVIGSPGYAPPEQYQGIASPQSDLYALGATLHRLLTGYDPEQGAPFTFPDAHALNPRVSPELSAVIARAVRLAPEERFSSAADMGRALQAAAGDRGGVGVRQHAWPADPRLLRQVFSRVGSLLMVATMGLWIIHAMQPPTAPAPSGQVWIVPAGNGSGLVITISPDGSGYLQPGTSPGGPNVPVNGQWIPVGRTYPFWHVHHHDGWGQPYDGWDQP